MKNSYEVIVRPIITEKATQLSEKGQYIFEIARNANRSEVKVAFETIFGKKVVSVNIIHVRKKEKKVGKYSGLTPAVKKAYIRLAEGETLDIFEV